MKLMIPALVVACAAAGSMAKPLDPRNILKTYFETGDIPTQSQFSSLIDSTISQSPDGVSIMDWVGLGAHSSNLEHDGSSPDSMSTMDALIVSSGGGLTQGGMTERTLAISFSFFNEDGEWATDESAVFRALGGPVDIQVGAVIRWSLDAPVTLSLVGDPLGASRTMTGGTYLETELLYVPSPASAVLLVGGALAMRRRR
ncbi:MAG: hypothetical protein ACI89L_001182 [Phycisphaerales bacterium]|jgi:hypothetical protein